MSVTTTIPATAMMPTAMENADVNPCTTATRETPPCAAAYDAVAEVAIVLRNATPSAPPTCCMVLTSALATPASWLGTPSSAVEDSGTNTCPIPRLISNMDGTTCVRYAESAGSWVSQSIPSTARENPPVASTRGPNRGSVRDAIVEDVMIPSGNGRNAMPALSAL